MYLSKLLNAFVKVKRLSATSLARAMGIHQLWIVFLKIAKYICQNCNNNKMCQKIYLWRWSAHIECKFFSTCLAALCTGHWGSIKTSSWCIFSSSLLVISSSCFAETLKCNLLWGQPAISPTTHHLEQICRFLWHLSCLVWNLNVSYLRLSKLVYTYIWMTGTYHKRPAAGNLFDASGSKQPVQLSIHKSAWWFFHPSHFLLDAIEWVSQSVSDW